MDSNFSLDTLTAHVLSEIFANAYIDTTIDEDGDVVIDDGSINAAVCIRCERDLLTFGARFGTTAPYLDVLAFVNHFNREVQLVKAIASDDQDEDGDWVITFEYDVRVYPKEHISASHVVRLSREFCELVHHGIAVADPGHIFPSDT